jgi:hypothetical protein
MRKFVLIAAPALASATAQAERTHSLTPASNDPRPAANRAGTSRFPDM